MLTTILPPPLEGLLEPEYHPLATTMVKINLGEKH